MNKPFKSINLAGKLMTFEFPKIMGILNVTPDSFSDGGKYNTASNIEAKVEQILEEGVDIIDVGGQSTRPGADDVGAEEETKRIALALDIIRKKNSEIVVSIDTFRASVADTAIKLGANIINDVSSGNLDTEIINIAAKNKVPYIAMHSRGNAKNMAQLTDYENITKEVIQFFAEKIALFIQSGISDIVIDPGFGFAKNIDQNYELLQNIKYLQELDRPVLVGVSRKSMIFRALNTTSENTLIGTTVLNTFAILNGADILRVHDVKEAKQVLELTKRLK